MPKQIIDVVFECPIFHGFEKSTKKVIVRKMPLLIEKRYS
jgi:hypothetical protein